MALFGFYAAAPALAADEASTAPAPGILSDLANKPIGLRSGNLLFFPSLTVQQDHDSNIYAAPTNEESGLVTHITPRLEITLAESRHDITLEGEYESRTYWGHDKESRHGFSTALSGSLVTSESGPLSLPFRFDWKRGYEEREDDLTGQNPVDPVRQEDFLTEMGIMFKPNSFSLGFLGRYNKLRFEDGRDTNNNRIVRRDANHDVTEVEIVSGFEFNPENELTLSAAVGENDYERRNFQAGGFNGPLRDARTYNVKAGWRFQRGRLSGNMMLGFADLDHDDTALSNIKTIIGDADISLALSEKTTLNTKLKRDIHEDDEIIGGIVRSHVGVFIDHHFLENTFLGAGVDYDFWEFQDIARDDDYWTTNLTADYIVNDRVAVGAAYKRTMRDSTSHLNNFERDVMMLTLRSRL